MFRKFSVTRRAGLAASVALAAVLGSLDAASGQTLEDAVRIALDTNPQIGASQANREAIAHELRQARGLYLPQVDVEIGYGPTAINDRNTRARSGDDWEYNDRQEASLVVQQRLFDGFETDSRVARETARVESAANRVYERSEFVSLDVVNAYLEVLRQRELVELARQNVEIHETILGSLQERLERGAGNIADVSQTETRLARAQATLTQRRNDLRDSEAVFNALVGQYPADLQMPEFADATLPPNADQTLEAVLTSNPTIKIREADVRAAEAGVDLAESAFYPDVNLEAESIYQDGTTAFDTYNQEHRVMLRLRWNLYSGGSDVAAKKEAVSRLSESKSERYQAVRDAREEVQRSWNALDASRQRVEELSRATDFAEQTRDAYREQFQVAQRTLLDVLDAENELFVARSQLATAENNRLFAKYRITALLGNLLNTLGVDRPAAAEPGTQSFSEDVFSSR